MLKLEWFNDRLLFLIITDTQTNKQDYKILNLFQVPLLLQILQKDQTKMFKKRKTMHRGLYGGASINRVWLDFWWCFASLTNTSLLI